MVHLRPRREKLGKAEGPVKEGSDVGRGIPEPPNVLLLRCRPEYQFYLKMLQKQKDLPSCLDYHRPNPNENAAYKQDMIFQNSKLFMIFQTFDLEVGSEKRGSGRKQVSHLSQVFRGQKPAETELLAGGSVRDLVTLQSLPSAKLFVCGRVTSSEHIGSAYLLMLHRRSQASRRIVGLLIFIQTQATRPHFQEPYSTYSCSVHSCSNLADTAQQKETARLRDPEMMPWERGMEDFWGENSRCPQLSEEHVVRNLPCPPLPYSVLRLLVDEPNQKEYHKESLFLFTNQKSEFPGPMGFLTGQKDKVHKCLNNTPKRKGARAFCHGNQ
ncbi:hypothetical protein MJG53_013760 [Ovis ammon polii x Ovis aries]|uniref:Uncharacterized protein n=1 Tax=Ovis ammon polii x Ovis aries TaxID=2918886 RepID=A0ACB9UJI4_9CETA|nr:hypothetical protein MJG53_013760 [Ovis ammon polii x Ovis aries]